MITALITASAVLILGLSVYRGWRLGLQLMVIDLGGFILATAVASVGYLRLSRAVERFAHWPPGLIKIIVFFVVWLTVETIYRLLVRRFEPKPTPDGPALKLPDRIGGAVFSYVQTIIVLALALLIILALPVSPSFKNNLTSAPVTKQLISATSVYQQQVNGLVSDISEGLNFLTVEPKSDDSLPLGFKTKNVQVDEATEQGMLRLINNERTSRGLAPLTMDSQITEVARAHSRDMLARGYFSHVTPEGKDPFDRMHDGGVKFLAAGENLALAPTLSLAHNGLMNSPGHRANILEPSFHRVGIGVIDAGAYGKMFTQDFSD